MNSFSIPLIVIYSLTPVNAQSFFRHIEKLNPELLDRSDGQIFDMMQWKCFFFAGHHCYRRPLDQATVGFNGS